MKTLLNTIFDRTVTGLERSMDLTYRRNNAITANITNAETPQYRAVDLNFASELNRAFEQVTEKITKTDAGHMDVEGESSAHLIQDFTSPTKPDGNNVDIDIQMARLAQNSGDFINAARLIRRQLGVIRAAIRAGER
jgi:flagellar basal-body rod protein FlgB